MLCRQFFVCALVAGAISSNSVAQTSDDAPSGVRVELNAVNETGAACRLTFVAENATGTGIVQAVYETVIFDSSGGVITLSLFDFRDLPLKRPRVRQFDVPGVACASVGRVLINGANTCTVEGEASALCERSLSVTSRIEVELLG